MQQKMDIDHAGLHDYIENFEGLKLVPYNDANHNKANNFMGNATWGYGHLIHLGPVCDCVLCKKFKAMNTQEEAEQVLHEDAQIAVNAVNQYVEPDVSQEEFDGLVDFAFNEGVGAFASSTLLKDLNAYDIKDIPGELAKWVRAGGVTLKGLVVRRDQDAAGFKADPRTTDQA